MDWIDESLHCFSMLRSWHTVGKQWELSHKLLLSFGAFWCRDFWDVWFLLTCFKLHQGFLVYTVYTSNFLEGHEHAKHAMDLRRSIDPKLLPHGLGRKSVNNNKGDSCSMWMTKFPFSITFQASSKDKFFESLPQHKLTLMEADCMSPWFLWSLQICFSIYAFLLSICCFCWAFLRDEGRLRCH